MWSPPAMIRASSFGRVSIAGGGLPASATPATRRTACPMSIGKGVKPRRSVDHAMPSGPGATFAGNSAGLLLLPGDEPSRGWRGFGVIL